MRAHSSIRVIAIGNIKRSLKYSMHPGGVVSRKGFSPGSSRSICTFRSFPSIWGRTFSSAPPTSRSAWRAADLWDFAALHAAGPHQTRISFERADNDDHYELLRRSWVRSYGCTGPIASGSCVGHAQVVRAVRAVQRAPSLAMPEPRNDPWLKRSASARSTRASVGGCASSHPIAGEAPAQCAICCGLRGREAALWRGAGEPAPQSQ